MTEQVFVGKKSFTTTSRLAITSSTEEGAEAVRQLFEDPDLVAQIHADLNEAAEAVLAEWQRRMIGRLEGGESP